MSNDIKAAGGTKLPAPKHVKIEAKDIRKLAPKIGKTQLARVGDGVEWNTFEIKNEIKERGYDPDAGPTPIIEEGAEYFLDRNRTMTALAELAEELPDLYGKIKVEILVYPKLDDDQRQEILNRAARSTMSFTVWDFWKQSMLRWKSRPDEDQLDHLKGMGVTRTRTFFPGCVGDHALIKTPNGVEIKPGLRADDVWGKGKGGNKQGPVQVGKALSRAHPRVVEAFFAARNDPEHSVTYREVIEHNTAWEADSKLRPDLANPPADFETLAKEFPESKLVATLGPRLIDGKPTQGGRGAGQGRMSKRDVDGLMVSMNFSQVCVIDCNRIERNPGYTGDDFVLDYEALHREVQGLVNSSDVAKKLIQRIFGRASAAAAANAKAAAEGEAARNAKK